MKSVSIVITTWHRPAQLAVTLASIRRQKYPDLEIIVVDPGKDKETFDLCQSADITYIRFAQPTGYGNPSRAINIGLRAAKNDYVILQNAECSHVDVNAIAKMADIVTDNNVVFAHVFARLANGSLHVIYCGPERPEPYFFCGMMARENFMHLRGMDEDFCTPNYDDGDFALRMAKIGLSFVYSGVAVDHQWHPFLATSMEPAKTIFERKKAQMEAGEIGPIRNKIGRAHV